MDCYLYYRGQVIWDFSAANWAEAKRLAKARFGGNKPGEKGTQILAAVNEHTKAQHMQALQDSKLPFGKKQRVSAKKISRSEEAEASIKYSGMYDVEKVEMSRAGTDYMQFYWSAHPKPKFQKLFKAGGIYKACLDDRTYFNVKAVLDGKQLMLIEAIDGAHGTVFPQ